MKRFLSLIVLMLSVAAMPLRAGDFVDFSPADKFIEVDAHLLGGATTIIQNYKRNFPQIQNLNVNMGESFGIGFRAVFGLKKFLGLGTALDLTVNKYNVDMAVLGSDQQSMSAMFIDNRFYYANFPIFASFRFDVDKSVRWIVDAGIYYSYGLGGTQKQRIYRADINAMDELVLQVIDMKTDYFHSPSTFINGFNRGDLGVHLATYIYFGPHLLVGARYQIGAKNVSRSLGVVNPSIHNHDFHAVVGYRF